MKAGIFLLPWQSSTLPEYNLYLTYLLNQHKICPDSWVYIPGFALTIDFRQVVNFLFRINQADIPSAESGLKCKDLMNRFDFKEHN